MPHPVLASRKVAVVTGGASGIGLAAAKKFIGYGMRVAIADLPGDRLAAAEHELGGMGVAMAVPTDVSQPDSLKHLERAVLDAFGSIDLLMNNAGIQPGSDIFGPPANWTNIIATNLMGIVHGTQIIVPRMIAQATPALVINTGSKQGITTPPGDPAYNVAKAGVKAFTEALQHHLRNIPGRQGDGAPVRAGLRLHRADRAGARRQARRRVDAGADRRLHDRAVAGARRLLHPVPRQRGAARDGRAPHPVGRRRHRREPAASVALARRTTRTPSRRSRPSPPRGSRPNGSPPLASPTRYKPRRSRGHCFR